MPRPFELRSFGTAADPVRVERVAVRVEPLHPVGLVAPLAVEERLDGRRAVALPGLHLRLGPVDRVDLGFGADTAEEVVARAPVVLEEPVGLDVVDDVAVPRRGRVAVEVPADNQATAPMQICQLLGADGAGGDIGVVDDRPDGLPARLCRGDVRYLCAHSCLNDRKYLLDGPSGGGDTPLQSVLDRANRRGKVVRNGFPMRKGRQRHRVGGRGTSHVRSFSEVSLLKRL